MVVDGYDATGSYQLDILMPPAVGEACFDDERVGVPCQPGNACKENKAGMEICEAGTAPVLNDVTILANADSVRYIIEGEDVDGDVVGFEIEQALRGQVAIGAAKVEVDLDLDWRGHRFPPNGARAPC